MSESVKLSQLIRFGDFEVDLRSGELRRNGVRVPLPEQSFQILAMLLERSGELVSRAAIQKKLWPNDTVVEFENSISAAVKRLRTALGDSADQPRYLETLPRKGYRWILPVQRIEMEAPDSPVAPALSSSEFPNVLIGKKVSHYRVLDILGGGGMGVVYKAEDLKLGRRVALKFLPEELASDPLARERLIREARAASTLSHPNICIIYEIEEHEAQLFIVMELLVGETLRELINTEGTKPAPRPLGRFLDMTIQIAEGLQAAHKNGIIHRDIKPANIFVTTDGQPKILDFGLAKLAADLGHPATDTAPATRHAEKGSSFPAGIAPEPTLSRTGNAMGTAGYMSPEQLRGEAVDFRTDIFSFGLVLYEMIAGRKAFDGQTAAALEASILHESPQPLRRLDAAVPSDLKRIVSKTLEKQPDNRYASTALLLEDLRRVRQQLSDAPKPRKNIFQPSKRMIRGLAIALGVALAVGAALGGRSLLIQRAARKVHEQDTIVLADFANSTGDTLFDDTLKPALASSLRQSPYLSILPDARVKKAVALMTLPDKTALTPSVTREICMREQSKAYIAGAIAALGSEYVIGLKAVHCASGEVIAQQQVTAESKDKVLSALSTATTKLREQLGESLSTLAKYDVPLDQTTSSLEALRAYNLGMKLGDQDSVVELQYLLRAIQLDPKFPMAYLAAAETYTNINQPGRAKEYLEKAFELRSHAYPREALEIESVYYSNITGELEKAQESFKKTIELYPRSPAPYGNLGFAYAQQGRFEKATELSRQVLQVFPAFGAEAYQGITENLLPLQRFDEAHEVLQTALDRKLDSDGVHKDLYVLGFLERNSSATATQSAWFHNNPAYENLGFALESSTEAYSGHLQTARQLTSQAIAAAVRSDNKEAAAAWESDAAIREALFGNPIKARGYAESALRSTRSNPQVEFEASLALSLAGYSNEAQTLAQDLRRQYPLHTVIQSKWLPTINAALELLKNRPTLALAELQSASSLELGNDGTNITVSCLFPIYMRGQAYLANGDGGAAAAEFQKIIDRTGTVWNCPTGALAYVGLGRANALQLRTARGVEADSARTRARIAYESFLALWSNADRDIPILKLARAEYAKLQ